MPALILAFVTDLRQHEVIGDATSIAARIIGGRYRLGDIVQSTRLGPVHRATPIDRERPVSLKLLSGVPLDSERRLATRFSDLMRTYAEISHPYIQPILDFGHHDGVPFVVSELSSAGTLADHLGTPQPFWDVLPIGKEIAEALDYAHDRGIVHGLLTLESIQYRVRGTAITDYGLGALVWMTPSRDDILRDIRVSPEQKGGDPASKASDVWAFGGILYALLTGEIPPDDTQIELQGKVSGVSDFAEAALRAARSPVPAERPGSAGALLRAVFATPTPVPVPIAEEPEPEPLQIPLLLHYKRPERDIVDASLWSLDLVPNLSQHSWPVLEPITDSNVPLPQLSVPEPVFRQVHEPKQRRLRKPSRLEMLAIVASVLVIGAATGKMFEQPRTSAGRANAPVLTSASGPGLWTMAGHNPARTAAAAEGTGMVEGKVNWSTGLGSMVTAGPVANAGSVLVGLADGRVVSIDSSNGKTRWEYRGVGPIEAGPAMTDVLTIVGLRDGRVVALDSHTGAPSWEFRTDGPITAAPVIVDGVVFVGSQDGNLRALDAISGALRWIYDAAEPIDAPPAMGNGLVLLSTHIGRIHVLDAATGDQRLIYRASGGVKLSPVLAGGFAYVATDRGVIQALNPLATTGIFEWQFRDFVAGLYAAGWPVGLPGAQPGHKWHATLESQVHSALAVGPHLVYVGTDDAKLSAFDGVTGEKKWQATLGAPVVGGPILSGDILFAATEDGRLAVFSAANGQKLWEISLTGKPRTSPALARGVLYTAVDDKLYAIR